MGAKSSTKNAAQAFLIALDKPVVIRALLELGVDPKLVSKPLLFPHCLDNMLFDTVELLLGIGAADACQIDGEGNAALHHLAMQRRIANPKSATQTEPLDAALKHRMAKLLLEYGADPSQRNAQGKTPADLLDGSEHGLKAILSRSPEIRR